MLAAGTVHALDIRTAAQEGSQPKFVVTGKAGKIRIDGICVEMMRAIERQEPSLRFVFAPQQEPLARIEKGMEEDDLDSNCLIRNAEREMKFQVVPTMMFSFDYHLVARADDNVQVNNWNDVRNLGVDGKLLVLRGTGAKGRLQQIGGLIVDDGGSTTAENLNKLVAGRARFFYYRTIAWKSEIARAEMDGKVRVLPTIMESIEFYLMLNKHVPKEVFDKISSALTALEKSGELMQIRKKWTMK